MVNRSDTTLVRITKDTWRKLHQLKDVGMSFDDVINQLLEKKEVS